MVGYIVAFLFTRATRIPLIFFIDTGASVSITTSLVFASTRYLRQALAKVSWKDQSGIVAISVVNEFRALGAHFTAGGNIRYATINKRVVQIADAIQQAAKLRLTDD